jgi:hypothetical protein
VKRVTEAQERALLRLTASRFVKTRAGWCEPQSGGLNGVQTQTINSLAVAGLVRIDSHRGPRHAVVTIARPGRDYLQHFRLLAPPSEESHAA